MSDSSLLIVAILWQKSYLILRNMWDMWVIDTRLCARKFYVSG
jgi:hypothetical protein